MIVQHMKSDPNAIKHADAGLYTFGFFLVVFIVMGINPLYAIITPFVTGVAIEFYQRLHRSMFRWMFIGFTHNGQNTIKESCLDVMQTGLFYVTYWVNGGR